MLPWLLIFSASTVPGKIELPSAEACSSACLHGGPFFLSWLWELIIFPLSWHILWAQGNNPFSYFCCWRRWPAFCNSQVGFRLKLAKSLNCRGTQMKLSAWSHGRWGEGGSSCHFSSWWWWAAHWAPIISRSYISQILSEIYPRWPVDDLWSKGLLSLLE